MPSQFQIDKAKINRDGSTLKIKAGNSGEGNNVKIMLIVQGDNNAEPASHEVVIPNG